MSFQLDIVTPEKTIFSDTVDDVYLPGSEGEMGVLDMHAALDDKVSVLIDLAIGEDAIDEAKVEEAMKRAQEALAGENVDHDEMAALQAAIAKSEAMLKLKRKRL